MTTDWDEERLAADVLLALTGARNSGLISQETYTWNMKQGGILPADRTEEQELDALATEGPAPIPKVGQPPPVPTPAPAVKPGEPAPAV